MKYLNSTKTVIFRAAAVGLLVEILTLPVAMLTMGHAGPEGPFAIAGWVGFLVNLPGFFIVFGFAPFNSQFAFAFFVFLIQMTLIIGAYYLIRLGIRRGSSQRLT